ncbi:hypothetical protein [Actinophytocola sp. NPDC049390]|uniref:hypothetical protein n=1 Tax=Actinophytocola sp. NPDC049390 TaxID=3363894 RepID=UPI0037AF7206
MGERTAGDGRSGYWFPLALLGFGMLALLVWDSVPTTEDVGWFAYAPESAGPGMSQTVLTAVAYHDSPVPLLATYPDLSGRWLVLLTACLVGTVAWYAVRARRAGRSVRGHVAVALGASAAIWVCYAIAGIADATVRPGEPVPSIWLPLVVLGVLAGAYSRLGARRRTAAVISIACLGAGVAVVLGAWAPGLLAPVLIAAGLLALARYERSRLVVGVACLVPVALLVVPEGTPRTLVPAVVLLAAAMVALARRDSEPLLR